MDYKFNKFQTPLTDELLNSLPKEVRNDLFDTLETIKFVQWLVSPEEVRGFAKNKQRWDNPNDLDGRKEDPNGRIYVDLTKPHILEDVNFFRERAIFFEKNKTYTHIPVNPNPKSAYALFWKEEVRRWKEGLIRPSDGEWITGYHYFYLNYVHMWINESTDNSETGVKKRRVKGLRKRNFPDFFLGDYLWFHYMEQARDNGKHCKLLKKRGAGFEQPISEKVITPYGEDFIGNIKVGDYVIGKDGKKTRVLEIFPQGIKDVYEITLYDKRKVRCGINHLWEIYDTSKKRVTLSKVTPRVYTTKELLEKPLTTILSNSKNTKYNLYIDKIEPVQFDKSFLPLHPYLIGFLLGDGNICSDQIRFYTADIDILPYIQQCLPENHLFKKSKSNKFEYTISATNRKNKVLNGCRDLKLNVLAYDKFIPNIYKYASIEDRLELVRGLLDTDGCITKKGGIEFTNVSKQLVNDLAYVLRSLGVNCTFGEDNRVGKRYIQGIETTTQKIYRLYIKTNLQLFRIPRKVDRIRNVKRKVFTPIIDIKKLDYQEESLCILVDNKDSMYLTTDFIPTHNSWKFGGITPCTMYTQPGLPNFHLASDKGYLEGDRGVFGKVVDVLDWIAENTPLPKLRLVDKPLEKVIGYKDPIGTRKGLLSSVFGISLKDDPDKARGLRGPIIQYEEDGIFDNLEDAWNVNLEAAEEGGIVFSTQIAGGTGGSEGANFVGSEKLFYNPEAYSILGIPNVFDRNTNGNTKCGFFWGAYLNRARCYNKLNGEPDVIKALIEVLIDRNIIKNSSPDTRALTQKKAEQPLTPQDAVMRIEGSIFPTGDLKEYLADISPNLQNFVSSHYIGDIVYNPQGEYIFKYTDNKTPVREFPIENNINKEGCIEIFELPQRDGEGKISPLRYIFGIDPVDDDSSSTNSLPSIIGFDRFTDRIVCEYTGRPKTAVEFYELCIRLIEFYNGTANYENDKKGLFSYFSNKHKLGLLCETPKILKDKQLVKDTALFGNKAVGTNSSKMVNAWGRRLQADWLVQPAYGEEETGKLNMHKIRSIGYLKELIAWNPDMNADRVSAMGMLMIYREDLAKFEIRQFSKKVQTKARDKFFSRNEKFPNFGYSMT